MPKHWQHWINEQTDRYISASSLSDLLNCFGNELDDLSEESLAAIEQVKKQQQLADECKFQASIFATKEQHSSAQL